jgi:hypothetical protein
VLNVPHAWKLFWTHTVELLGDVGHVESHFGLFGDCINVSPFRDSANLDTRSVHGLHLMYHRLKNRFGCTRWNS